MSNRRASDALAARAEFIALATPRTHDDSLSGTLLRQHRRSLIASGLFDMRDQLHPDALTVLAALAENWTGTPAELWDTVAIVLTAE